MDGAYQQHIKWAGVDAPPPVSQETFKSLRGDTQMPYIPSGKLT